MLLDAAAFRAGITVQHADAWQGWYTKAEYLCTSATACNSTQTHQRISSDYDMLQVFLKMKGKESGFRIEIHRPAAAAIQQPYKIGSFALQPARAGPSTSDQMGWQDILLTDSDGEAQPLSQLLPQLFLPYPGQELWPGDEQCPAPHQLRMFVHDQEVPQNSNLWSRVLQSGGQRSPKIPIKTAMEGEVLGHLQLMKIPQKRSADGAEVPTPTGIIFVMPGSDAVFNLHPEVSLLWTSCRGQVIISLRREAICRHLPGIDAVCTYAAAAAVADAHVLSTWRPTRSWKCFLADARKRRR